MHKWHDFRLYQSGLHFYYLFTEASVDYISHLDVINPDSNAALLTNWSGYNTSYGDQVSLVEQLQTTLDISQQLSIFLHALSNSFKITGIELETYHGKFEAGNASDDNERLSLPIRIHDQLMGRVIYYSQKPITDIFLSSLSNFQKRLVFPLRNALAFWQLQQLALQDSLTGIGNRASYNDGIGRALLQAKRHQQPFALLVLDLDNFKQVNDQYGHQIGDDLLIQFVALTNDCLRGTDQFFRFGGDEFAIILEHDNHNSASVVTKRLLDTLTASPVVKKYDVSVSIGCSYYKDGDTEASLFARADKALYQAKTAGKNRVEFA